MYEHRIETISAMINGQSRIDEVAELPMPPPSHHTLTATSPFHSLYSKAALSLNGARTPGNAVRIGKTPAVCTALKN